MIEIKEKKDCCGCYGCENICPKNCITMKDDNEGFWYPEVDEDICIKCGLCVKVCPIIQPVKKVDNIKFLACKNKKEIDRLNSSSGGVFSLLMRENLASNGVVFGAGYDQNLNVKYSYARTLEEVKKFRGSKYVQSRMENSYIEAKQFLEEGQQVIFSGTPCHIAGFKKFLRKEYKNLLLIDIACHGVPSPGVFHKYKKHLREKYKSELINIKFRNKEKGWKNYNLSFKLKNGQEISEVASENIYMKGFLKDLYLRPSCYACNFKKPYTEADITLADYWGIQNIHPEFDDDKGTSLVLVHTKKGQEALSLISKQIEVIETDGEFAIQHNPCIVRPVQYNHKRDKFFEDFEKVDLIKNIKRNTKTGVTKRFKRKLKSILRR